MTDTPITVGPLLITTLTLLTVSAAVVVWLGRIGTARSVVLAVARAVVQLAAVSLLIAAVVKAPAWSALFVLMMFLVATITSATRIGTVRTAWRVAGSIAGGVAPVLGLLLSTGSIVRTPVVLIRSPGILIGGSMTATSLAGTRALDELRGPEGRVRCRAGAGVPAEGGRAGDLPAVGGAGVDPWAGPDANGWTGHAARDVRRGVARRWRADSGGITQLVVLISLLAAQGVAVLVTVELVASGLVGRPTG